MISQVSIFATLLLGSALGQVINSNECPEVKVVNNFQAAEYLGTWHEAKKYYAAFEIDMKCNSAQYSLNANGSVDVLNSAFNERTKEAEQISGTANLVEADKGLLEVYFPSQDNTADYYILDTDYKNWAAVFSCRNLGDGTSAQFAWLLTRDRSACHKVIAEAESAFKSQNIDTKSLIKTDQTNCDN